MIDNIKDHIYLFLKNNHIFEESQEVVCHILLLLLGVLLSWLTGYICRKILAPLILKVVRKTDTLWDDYLLNAKLVRAVCRIIPGLMFYILAPYLLPNSYELLSNIVIQGSKIYIALTIISLTIVFLNNVETFTKEEERLKEKHLYGFIEFLKMLVYFIGGIIIIAFFIGESPLSMVAGIGAAATVLMLVFKDSILGLVAGIQLSTNRMIKPGDWITIKKSNIDGVVEKVSLTTVKVRNFDNTIYTVPPYTLISETFQNWSVMYEGGGRRMKRALYIDQSSVKFVDGNLLTFLVNKQYLQEKGTTATKGETNLTLFREYTERYLKDQSFVLQERTLLTRQLAPTPYGLPLEFYFFLKTTDFVTYEKHCAACMEHFIAALPDFGLSIHQVGYGPEASL